MKIIENNNKLLTTDRCYGFIIPITFHSFHTFPEISSPLSYM